MAPKKRFYSTPTDIDVVLEISFNYGINWVHTGLLMEAIAKDETQKFSYERIKHIHEYYGKKPENNTPNKTKHFKKINELKKTPSAYELLQDLKQDLGPETRKAWEQFMVASADVIPLLKGSGTFIDKRTGDIVRDEPGYYSDSMPDQALAPEQPPVSDDSEETPDKTPVSASQDLQHQGIQQQGFEYGQDMAFQYTMSAQTLAAWTPQPPRIPTNTEVVGPLGERQRIGPMYQQLGTYPYGTSSLVQQTQAPGLRLDEATMDRNFEEHFHQGWKPANAAEAAVGTEGLEP